MGTLSMHTPRSEYLEGKWYKKDKETSETSEGVAFLYRNPSDKEVDQVLENQPIKGIQMDKKSNIIYTSTPITFSGSDELELEDQGRKRKVKKVIFDRSKSARTDLRLRGVRNKDIHLGKFITLE